MKLSIQKHINLGVNHPHLPEWLFRRDHTIITQTIELDETHMKELIIFLDRHSDDFIIEDMRVCVACFDDITLEYK